MVPCVFGVPIQENHSNFVSMVISVDVWSNAIQKKKLSIRHESYCGLSYARFFSLVQNTSTKIDQYD